MSRRVMRVVLRRITSVRVHTRTAGGPGAGGSGGLPLAQGMRAPRVIRVVQPSESSRREKLKHRWLAALAALAVACASNVFAQGGAGSTGSIQGEVTDESGGVLPGVTVTVGGESMMGVRSDTTDAQGRYRFLGLPAGTYKLTYELSGFGIVSKENSRIGIGVTATENAKLGVKTLSESVTVTDVGAAIDTTATRVQTNYRKEQLDALPNARDMWSLLSTAPAVSLNRFDVGGS